MSLGSVLIVGGGLIGGAFAARLRDRGTAVHQLTRRDLDLADDPSRWPRLPVADTAFLGAAVTSMAACAEDPRGTERINVAATVALAERLVGQGTHVTFLSSNQVFDGSLPARGRDDPVCPISAYGRQKAAAEAALLALHGDVAVLRLTKVLDSASGLVADWRRALRGEQPIHPFANLSLAPVDVEFVLGLLAAIGGARGRGLFHGSAAADVSYVNLGDALASALGADRSLLRPVTLTTPPAGHEALPRFTSLEMNREAAAFGIAAPPARAVIDRVVATVGA